MTPTARKLLLAVHVAASVGWLGAIVAYIPFDVGTATSADPATLRASYHAMDVIARVALVPLALVALASGVLVSLTTPWGLFRHWWVVLSLVLTTLATVVLLVETRTIAELARAAATADDDALRALPSTLPHSLGGLIVLAFVLGLNVVKPRGLTRHGWRKQQEARATGGDGDEPAG